MHRVMVSRRISIVTVPHSVVYVHTGEVSHPIPIVSRSLRTSRAESGVLRICSRGKAATTRKQEHVS